MRKLTTLFILLAMSLSMWAGIHTYTDTSVLKEGKWVKIRVSESGVCRMSFSQLRDAGLEPTQLRVYGFGGALLAQDFTKAKIDDLPQVPVYVGADYVLFWVQGPISWRYTGSRFAHTRNHYSDYGYYLLSDNAGPLLPPAEGEAVVGTPTEVTRYLHYQVHHYDSLNLVDKTGVSGGGRNFYGEQFTVEKTRTFTFPTPNAITTENSSVYAEMAAYASTASYFKATLNDGTTKSAYIKAPQSSDFYTFGCAGTLSFSGASAATQQKVDLKLQNSSTTALGWLDYIEVTTPSELRMTGSYMPVRTNVNYQSSTPVRFHLTDANASTQVWDVTNLAAIKKMPTSLSEGELTWIGTNEDGVHEYVAFNPGNSGFVSAQVVGSVSNQNLHVLKDIDYVIICPEGYETMAQELAQAHETKQGITWAVVTDQQVYNEFSSGTPDATAYRWLMKMLYDRANGNDIHKPRWLLLIGHGSFDNRKLLPNSGTSLLLTYQAKNSLNEVKAYMTDDYFGFLDDNEGEEDSIGRLDIGVGRLPVNNTSEARTTIDKLIKYISNTNVGKWKNQIVFVADDGEQGMHTRTAEEGAEKVRLKNPDFVVNKIYLDAYPQEVNASGESYPLAKNRLANLLKSGVLFFDYSGHGGYNSVTSEGILNIKDIENMTNRNLAFWFFATCNFAECDAGKRCAAEASVLNPNGGSVGILAATRTVYAGQNTDLNRAVCDTLFGHKNAFHYDITLGEAISAGKNRLSADENKLAYVLLGDPAMRLNYPTDYQVETTTKMDTLNALSVQNVQGRIIDEDSLTVENFAGTLDVTIYDKLQTITTRDNDDTSGEPVLLEYKDYPNTIFSGSTQVKEGLFSFTFMVPKDIRYNFGNGRIVYYAHDSITNSEAVGHFEEFIVGGTGNSLLVDTVGPTMKLYLNCTSFKDGDKTYESPRFFAELEDEHGINTSGAGIGHDLLLTVDNDPKQIYAINEYFTAENNSYQKGLVSYRMEKLEDGPHTLTFRAWDLLNNSTTQSLNFIVETGYDPSIASVTSYPNPVHQTGVVNLIIEYDQPDEMLETEVFLYNVNGQMVYDRMQENPERIAINLSSLSLQPGVYVYNVKIKSASNKYSTMSGKIIITR